VKVVVLGAGVIGLSIADSLARQRADVTVIDMRAPGLGASHASAGMLAPYSEGHGDQHLLRLLARGLVLFDDYLPALVADTGVPVEYARSGTLEVALDDEAALRLESAKRLLDDAGISADLLDSRSLREYEPSVTSSALRGLVIHAHGFVGVQSFVAALTERARFKGATFESPVEAASIDAARDSVKVEAGTRRYEADVAVLATGSWSRRVRVRHVAALPVRPVRGQLLHLTWSGSHQPQRIVWGPRCYTVPWPDGTLLVGATVEEAGFDEHATVEGVRMLTSAVTELLPGAANAQLDAVRVGLRPALPDGLPAIGPIARAPRVVVATGHYRNGVLLAPLTAELVSRFILDGVRDPAFEITTPDRFLT